MPDELKTPDLVRNPLKARLVFAGKYPVIIMYTEIKKWIILKTDIQYSTKRQIRKGCQSQHDSLFLESNRESL